MVRPALRIVEEHGHLDSSELRERILREIEAFVGSADQHDDMTMILLKVEPMKWGSRRPLDRDVAAGTPDDRDRAGVGSLQH